MIRMAALAHPPVLALPRAPPSPVVVCMSQLLGGGDQVRLICHLQTLKGGW